MSLKISRTLTFKKFFAKLKLSPVFFKKKIPWFACLIYKNGNKWILFSWKTGWFKKIIVPGCDVYINNHLYVNSKTLFMLMI